MEPRLVFWETEFKLPGTSWTISGYSRSAYRSGFYISGLNIMLDGGPQCFKKPEYIFITHTHGDHVAELPFTMIQDTIPLTDDDKIKLFCPEEATNEMRNYIMQLHNTNSLKDTKDVIKSYYIMNPVSAIYNKQRLTINKQLMLLETVSADHTIPTVVYGFSLI